MLYMQKKHVLSGKHGGFVKNNLNNLILISIYGLNKGGLGELIPLHKTR